MDGLKARLSFDAIAYDYDDEYLTIDTDTHTININNVSRLFGVQYDGNSKLIKFRIRNKLSDIQKMQDSIVYINWIDSKGVKGQSIAINKTINNDTCEFAWKVPFDALKNSGVLHFAMSAVITENNSSVINQKWSTQIASVITPDGIYIKSYTPSSEEEDRIAQIYNELSKMINTQISSLKEDIAEKIDKPTSEDNNKFLRAKNGGVEWVEQGLPTDEQTANAVRNWLDEHPEATTTVQDGSLTEPKFSQELRLKTIKDYVTPQMFGAIGDGVTDDALAFEQALESGEIIFVPSGDYYLSKPLSNPSEIKLIGAGRKKTRIKLDSGFIQNEINGGLISDITFYNDNAENKIVVFPAYVSGSKIQNCVFSGFYQIFFFVRTVSRILNNGFTRILNVFCRNAVDSFFIGNYINAPKVKNPQAVCFAHQIIHCTVSNNFIDFMYKVFACDSKGYMNNVSVVGNIFDVCYCIFFNVINGVTFTGNTISNLKKRSDWDVSKNEDMNTRPWCVMKRASAASIWASSYLGGNTFYGDIDMYMSCDSFGYPTIDLTVDEHLRSDLFDYKSYKSNTQRDFENIKIRPMLKRTVDVLPTGDLSGQRSTFNFDEVLYDGKIYININGTWKQMTS